MPALLNRERAILEFNRRVLAQARRADVPLLERLRYVCIVSSNLDEFFEVRFADIVEAARRPGAGRSMHELSAVAADAHTLIDEQYAVFNDEVMPLLNREGIVIVNHADRDAAQRRWVKQFSTALSSCIERPAPGRRAASTMSAKRTSKNSSRFDDTMQT